MSKKVKKKCDFSRSGTINSLSQFLPKLTHKIKTKQKNKPETFQLLLPIRYQKQDSSLPETPKRSKHSWFPRSFAPCRKVNKSREANRHDETFFEYALRIKADDYICFHFFYYCFSSGIKHMSSAMVKVQERILFSLFFLRLQSVKKNNQGKTNVPSH